MEVTCYHHSPEALYPEKESAVRLFRRLCEPQIRFGCFWKREKLKLDERSEM